MKTVLFVCMGNTCRSPMAEALFNNQAQKAGLDYRAKSCGIYTKDGLPYAENSIKALSEQKIELCGSSTLITEEILSECDYVFGLTQEIGQAVICGFEKYANKVYRFPLDVPDPFGGDIFEYKKCMEKISEGIEEIIKTLGTKDEALGT